MDYMLIFPSAAGVLLSKILPDSVKQRHAKLIRDTASNAVKIVSPRLSDKVKDAFDTSQRFDQSVDNACTKAISVAVDGVALTAIKQALAAERNKRGVHTGAQINDCQLADHLKRTGAPIPLYSHHAIYIGEGCVMHYAGPISDVEIKVSTLEEFAAGQHVAIVSEYRSALLFSREEAVRRAYQRYAEREYNLVINNCENFVRWCRAGD